MFDYPDYKLEDRISKIMGGRPVGYNVLEPESEPKKEKDVYDVIEEIVEEEEFVENVRYDNPIKESIKEMILDGDIQLAWAESSRWNSDKKIVLSVKQHKSDGGYEMKQQDAFDGLELDIRVGY